MLDSRGSSKISALIYLSIAVLVFYLVVKTIPVYMRYYSMDDEVFHQLEMSKINNAETIRGDLIEKARELGIPLKPEDMELTYDAGENLRITMSWEETVDYGHGFVKEYTFNIDTAAEKQEQNQ